MSFEELDAHYHKVKVDAHQEYLDLVLAALHDSAIEEKHLCHADVGFEVTGGGKNTELQTLNLKIAHVARMLEIGGTKAKQSRDLTEEEKES